ncbi:MAG TPA: TlpA disulfide reductase family protein [Planctomycetota bacterium]|nr:TlpA disulfide reductase family protein [Planctomycetota bacterium]
MNQSKLIALWAAAMVGLAVLYWYTTRDIGTPTAKPQPAMPGSDETSLPIGSAMVKLDGTWLDEPAPEFKNKVVLLDFWSTFCVPCIASIPSNNKIFKEYAPKGLVLVGVAAQPKGMIDDFRKQRENAGQPISYPQIVTREATFKAYGIQAIPSTFLFDRHGKLVWKGAQLDNRDGSLHTAFERALREALAEPAE